LEIGVKERGRKRGTMKLFLDPSSTAAAGLAIVLLAPASLTFAWTTPATRLASYTQLSTLQKTAYPRLSFQSFQLNVKGDVEEDKQSKTSKKVDATFQNVDAAPKILGEPIPYSELTVGVLKETFPGERRVSQTPDSVRNLVKAGFTVLVQAGGEYEEYYDYDVYVQLAIDAAQFISEYLLTLRFTIT
jgi:hypothetical protein